MAKTSPNPSNKATSTDLRSVRQELRQELAKIPPLDIRKEHRDQMLKLLRAGAEEKQIVAEYIAGRDAPLLLDDDTIDSLRSILSRENEAFGHAVLHIRSAYQQFGKCAEKSREETIYNDAKRSEIFRSLTHLTDPVKENTYRIKRTELAVRCLAAMVNTDIDKMRSCLEQVAEHKGSIPLWRQYLECADNFDPFDANKRMRVTVLTSKALTELREEGVIIDESDVSTLDDDHGRDVLAAVSAPGMIGSGGTLLTSGGRKFVARDPQRTKLAFSCCRQAILKIKAHRYGESADEDQTDRRRATQERAPKSIAEGSDALATTLNALVDAVDATRHRDNLSALEEVSLDELEKSDSYQTIARTSPILARELKLYKELRASIEALKGERHQLVHHDRILTINSRKGEHARILSHPGGAWFAALGKLIADQEAREAQGDERHPGSIDVPDFVRECWAELNETEVVSMSNEREQLLTQGIFSWFAPRIFIDRELALGEIVSDIHTAQRLLEQEETLPQDHPVRALKGRIRPLLEQHAKVFEEGTAEISLYDMCVVQDDTSIASWRSAMNAYHFSRYRADFFKGLELLRECFQERVVREGNEWQWLPHAQKQSVPYEILGNTLYGHPFLARSATTPTPALNRTDWRYVRDALDLIHISADGRSLDFAAHSLTQFEAIVRGTIVAAGKAAYLDTVLKKDGIVLEDRGSEELGRPTKFALNGALDDWRPSSMLVGGHDIKSFLRPACELNLPEQLGATPEERLKEFIRRYESQLDRDSLVRTRGAINVRSAWTELKSDIALPAQVGLFMDPKKDGANQRRIERLARTESLLALCPIADSFVPSIESAVGLLKAPLVVISQQDKAILYDAWQQVGRIENPPERAPQLLVRRWYTNGYLTEGEEKRISELAAADLSSYRESSETVLENVRSMNTYVERRMFWLSANGMESRVLTYEDFGRRQHEIVEAVVDPVELTQMLANLSTNFVAGDLLRMQPGVNEAWFAFVDATYPNPMRNVGTLPRSSELQSSRAFVEKDLIATVTQNSGAGELRVGVALADSGLSWGEVSHRDTVSLEPILGSWSKNHSGKSVLALPLNYMEFVIEKASHQPDSRREIFKRALEVRKTMGPSRSRARESFLKWLKSNYGS